MLGEDVNDGEDLTEGGMRKTWYSEPHLSTMLVRTPARKDIQAFRGRAAGPKNETGRPKIHRPGCMKLFEFYCSATTITAGAVPPDSSIENNLVPLVIATVCAPMLPVPSERSESVALTLWPDCRPAALL